MSSLMMQPRGRGASTHQLNPQQRMFVQLLLADPTFNAERAAKGAGYKSPGSSAAKLLKHKVVSAAVGKAIHDRIERTKVTQDRVVEELACIAFSNIQEILDEGDLPQNLKNLPEKVARSISGVEYEWVTSLDEKTGKVKRERVIRKITYWDKGKALMTLAKHLGMITEKHEVTGDVKVTLDYEKLYRKVNARVIGVDPIEAAIADPKAYIEKSQYTVDELLSEKGEDEAEPSE